MGFFKRLFGGSRTPPPIHFGSYSAYGEYGGYPAYGGYPTYGGYPGYEEPRRGRNVYDDGYDFDESHGGYRYGAPRRRYRNGSGRRDNPTGGPPGFVPVGNNNNRNNNGNPPAPQRAHNAPNQAPPARGPGVQGQGQGDAQPPPPPPPQQQQQQQQQQPEFHQMPAMNNARGPQPAEADPHLQPGGQAEFGERPRGQGRSEDADAEPGVPDGGRGGGAPDNRPPQHPWMPETRFYNQQQTRRRR